MKKVNGVYSVNPLISLARLAGFEPATHGLEVKAPELHNLLYLLQLIDLTIDLVSTFWQIFHPVAHFGGKFSHRVSHSG